MKKLMGEAVRNFFTRLSKNPNPKTEMPFIEVDDPTGELTTKRFEWKPLRSETPPKPKPFIVPDLPPLQEEITEAIEEYQKIQGKKVPIQVQKDVDEMMEADQKEAERFYAAYLKSLEEPQEGDEPTQQTGPIGERPMQGTPEFFVWQKKNKAYFDAKKAAEAKEKEDKAAAKEAAKKEKEAAKLKEKEEKAAAKSVKAAAAADAKASKTKKK